MNNIRRIKPVALAILAVALVAGCTTPQATSSPTITPITCPTAPACPTSAAQAPHTETGLLAQVPPANATITFDPGDQCSLDIQSNFLYANSLVLNIVVNDQSYQDYIVFIETLTAPHTLEDLNPLIDRTLKDKPSYVDILASIVENPGDNSHHSITIATENPLYFSCAVGGGSLGEHKIINNLGPLETH